MSAVDSERAVSAICGLFTSGNTDAWRGTTQCEPEAPVMVACTSGVPLHYHSIRSKMDGQHVRFNMSTMQQHSITLHIFHRCMWHQHRCMAPQLAVCMRWKPHTCSAACFSAGLVLTTIV